jgi:hypothetical protein
MGVRYNQIKQGPALATALPAVGSFLSSAFGVGTATTAAGVATGGTTAASVLAAGGTQAAIGAGTALGAAKIGAPKAQPGKKPTAMPDEKAIQLASQRTLAQKKGSRSQSILTNSETDSTKLG